ncbi:MAG: Hsp70 family protein [Myxococcales bacterium]|nr:Hsp70 family protein [Myxococcales bacterium]
MTVAIGLDLGLDTVRVTALVDDRPVAVTAFPAAVGLDGAQVRVGRRALALPPERRVVDGTAAERLGWLVRAAVLAVEAEHGPVLGAVVPVAPGLGAVERRVVHDAAIIAGLPAVRLCAAPVAIAMALPAAPDGRWLVADAGAAALSVTVLERSLGAIDRLATVVEPALGGRALDRVIAEHLARGLDLAGEPPPPLVAAAAALRAHLGDAAAAEAAFASALAGAAPPLAGLRPPRRDELELWLAPRVRKLDDACARALAAAGCAAHDLGEVVLAGGGARSAALARRLGQVMGRPARLPTDPGFAAALGAASLARLFVAEPAALVVDVLRHGLALASDDDPRSLIAAGTVLPTRETLLLPTGRDEQTALELELWEETAPPRALGRWRLAGLPAAPAGDALAACSVTVDVDGLPRVSATELVSGLPLTVTPLPEPGVDSGLDAATLAACRAAVEAWQP